MNERPPETPSPEQSEAMGQESPHNAPETETAEPVSVLEGSVGILTSPGATFEKIAKRPSWRFIVPLLLLIIASAVSSVIYSQRADMREVIRGQIRKNPRAAQMTDAQMEKGIDFGMKMAKMGPYIGFVVITLKYLIVALIFWLVILAFGDKISFGNTFRVVSWSQWPNIILALLFLVVIFVRDPTYLDPKNPVMTNLGAIFGEKRLGKPLYALLSDLDILTIWMLWLYTRGLAAFTKAKVGKMAAIVFGLFCIPVLFHFALAIIF
jgi:hypothetical protein